MLEYILLSIVLGTVYNEYVLNKWHKEYFGEGQEIPIVIGSVLSLSIASPLVFFMGIYMMLPNVNPRYKKEYLDTMESLYNERD